VDEDTINEIINQINQTADEVQAATHPEIYIADLITSVEMYSQKKIS
jgi:hypothetical protein